MRPPCATSSTCLEHMAGKKGLEPPTSSLTARCSAVELLPILRAGHCVVHPTRQHSLVPTCSRGCEAPVGLLWVLGSDLWSDFRALGRPSGMGGIGYPHWYSPALFVYSTPVQPNLQCQCVTFFRHHSPVYTRREEFGEHRRHYAESAHKWWILSSPVSTWLKCLTSGFTPRNGAFVRRARVEIRTRPLGCFEPLPPFPFQIF